MTFFDDTVVNTIKKQREEIKKNIEEYQASTKKLTPTEIKEIIKEIKKHYIEQLTKPVHERELFEKDGAIYTVFETHEEKIEKDGEAINLPSQTKNGSWRLWCKFPLMTEEGRFPESITIFVSDEEFTFNSWKCVVLAKGRMRIEYKLLDDTGYGKPLTKFLKECGVDSLDELDHNDYEKKYTFSVDQVLETKVIR